MLENPIYNNPGTGVKKSNPGLQTLQYQFVKILRGSVKLLEIATRAMVQLGKDVIRGIFKSS